MLCVGGADRIRQSGATAAITSQTCLKTRFLDNEGRVGGHKTQLRGNIITYEDGCQANYPH